MKLVYQPRRGEGPEPKEIKSLGITIVPNRPWTVTDEAWGKRLLAAVPQVIWLDPPPVNPAPAAPSSAETAQPNQPAGGVK